MWIEWKPVGSNGNLLLSGSMKKGLSLLFVLEEKEGGDTSTWGSAMHSDCRSFTSQVPHLLAAWPWTSYFISQKLYFSSKSEDK